MTKRTSSEVLFGGIDINIHECYNLIASLRVNGEIMSKNNDTFVDGINEVVDVLERPALAAFAVGAVYTITSLIRNGAAAVSAGVNDWAPAIQSRVEGLAPVASHLAQAAFHLMNR